MCGTTGRIQDRSRAAGDRWRQHNTAVGYRVAQGGAAREGTRPDPQPAPHWRYRAGADGFARVDAAGKRCRNPEPEVKTCTASTETVERLPLHAELETRRRWMLPAHTARFVGDGGDFVWRTAKQVAELWRGDAKELVQALEEKVAELAPRGRSGTRATASMNTASAFAATRSAGTACP